MTSWDRKEIGANPNGVMGKILFLKNFQDCNLSLNLTCKHTHSQLVDKFSTFLESERTVQGIHFDAIGPYFLQISDYRKHEFLCHYLTVFLKYFFHEFPSDIHSMVFH